MNSKVGEDVAVVERIIEQVTGLLREQGPRILKCYRKTDRVFPVALRISLKGDNSQMSAKTTINYTEDKISDFAEQKIDMNQGSFVFEEGEKPTDISGGARASN